MLFRLFPLHVTINVHLGCERGDVRARELTYLICFTYSSIVLFDDSLFQHKLWRAGAIVSSNFFMNGANRDRSSTLSTINIIRRRLRVPRPVTLKFDLWKRKLTLLVTILLYVRTNSSTFPNRFKICRLPCTSVSTILVGMKPISAHAFPSSITFSNFLQCAQVKWRIQNHGFCRPQPPWWHSSYSVRTCQYSFRVGRASGNFLRRAVSPDASRTKAVIFHSTFCTRLL